MIMTVAELKAFIATDEADQALEARLQALELLIRAYTNNNFQARCYRRGADIIGGVFQVEALTPFEPGDTVQITQSCYNNGLYTVRSADASTFSVNEPVKDEGNILVTKVEYPADVKMGVVGLLKWELKNREKVGVSSESISRHNVTYYDMGRDNTESGYPVSLMGFLKPYMRARFGQGVRV